MTGNCVERRVDEGAATKNAQSRTSRSKYLSNRFRR